MNNSMKSLKKALSECAFNPREPGSLTTIISCNDEDYLVLRVQEMLRDAQRFDGAQKRARLRDAAALLAYAMTLLPSQEQVSSPSDRDPCGS